MVFGSSVFLSSLDIIADGIPGAIYWELVLCGIAEILLHICSIMHIQHSKFKDGLALVLY